MKDEIILDPFVGSDPVCIAAVKAKRHYVGYDIDKNYVKLAETRIKQYIENHSVPLFERKDNTK